MPRTSAESADGSRRATVDDIHEIARSLPGVKLAADSRPTVYQVSRRSFLFFRNPRPDAVDPTTGERYADVIVFWVDSEFEKEAMLADTSLPFFTTPHFDGHASVLLRGSRVGELTRDELAEFVERAWLSRAGPEGHRPLAGGAPPLTYYLLNFSNKGSVAAREIREKVATLLRLKMWSVDTGEPHRAALAEGDNALIYVGAPLRAFVGHARLASAVRGWTPAEAETYPGDSRGGVLLADVEEWDPPVPMHAVVERIDPTGSNPYVQVNARNGFQNGIVQITDHEYEAVVAVPAETAKSRD